MGLITDTLLAGFGAAIGERIAAARDALDTRVTALEGAAGGGANDWTYVILGSAFEVTVTSNTNVPGLSFQPQPNKRYEIEARFFLQSAATTTGVRPGINWPTAGILQNTGWMTSPNSATAFASRFWGAINTLNAAATGVPVANEGVHGRFEGLLVTGPVVTGPFQIALASEIAGSAARIMENSFLRYREY